jgi:hypothetical protein
MEDSLPLPLIPTDVEAFAEDSSPLPLIPTDVEARIDDIQANTCSSSSSYSQTQPLKKQYKVLAAAYAKKTQPKRKKGVKRKSKDDELVPKCQNVKRKTMWDYVDYDEDIDDLETTKDFLQRRLEHQLMAKEDWRTEEKKEERRRMATEERRRIRRETEKERQLMVKEDWRTEEKERKAKEETRRMAKEDTWRMAMNERELMAMEDTWRMAVDIVGLYHCSLSDPEQEFFRQKIREHEVEIRVQVRLEYAQEVTNEDSPAVETDVTTFVFSDVGMDLDTLPQDSSSSTNSISVPPVTNAAVGPALEPLSTDSDPNR